LAAGLATGAFAQKSDTADYGKEHSFPWIAHSAIDVFYLHTPAEPGRPYPYQASLYQGFTIQSLSFAWFHVGIRSRETYAYGLDEPYREPMILKLQGSVELLKDLAYVSLGGTLPVVSGDLHLDDSLALYETINGYSGLPYADFLAPQAIQAAAFGRYAWTNWTAMAGVGYARATLFRELPGKAFYPAAYFDLFGRAIYQGRSAVHRVDARASLYGEEQNADRIAAHEEGDLYQLRYEWLKPLRRISWQLGAGASAKPPDRNRRIKLKSELPLAGKDENLQRAYGEAALTWVPSPDILWRVHLLPKAIFSWNGEHAGYEAESGLGVGLKVWEYHRIRATGTMLYGNMDGKQYLGFGIHAEFAFRHLGIQDLDDGAGLGEGE
jgi:hypothetical protein